MKTNLIYVTVLLLLVPSVTRALDCSQMTESNATDLIQFLETQARTADPECVTSAIVRLGGFKTVSAIPVLIDLLDFRRPDSDLEKMHAFDPHDRFPAVPALFAVGDPAATALIAKLKTGQANSAQRKNAIRTVVLLHRNNPQEAVRLLKTAANNATDPHEASQLDSSARDAVAFCAQPWRVQCQEEVNK